MNNVCPLCNSLEEMQVVCEHCQIPMKDCGKIVDHLDQYSAYEDIDTLKLADGDEQSLKNGICLHVFVCPSCFLETTVPIKEWIT